MPDWPLWSGADQRASAIGAVVTSSQATTVTSDSNGAKVWVQLIASTPFAGNALLLQVGPNNAGRCLLDIGIGPSGSEVVVVPDLYFGFQSGLGGPQHIPLPLAIPAGARVAARVATTNANGSVIVGATLLDGSFNGKSPAGRVLAWGIDTGQARGTEIPSGSFNAKGGWTTLGTPTAACRGFFILHGPQAWFGVDMAQLIDVGIGGAGSEQVLVPDLMVKGLASAGWYPWVLGPFDIALPANTRVSLRKAQSYNGSASTYAALYTLH